MSFVVLKSTDICVGKPLPWPIYDGNRQLLLKAGFVIENQRQLETLLERGLYRSVRQTFTRPGKEKKEEARAAENDVAQNESTIDFDDINLQVGASVQVQSADGGGQRYFAKVIGFVKGKSLLVSNPVVDDKLIFVREGQSFIVRVFDGKSAFGFSASILKACTAPVAYLHLSFPTRIQGVAIRRSDRMDVKLIASIQPKVEGADKATLPALILNVSPAGALIHAKQPIGKIGDPILVTFRIKLNMIDGYVEADGIIRSIKEAEEGQPNAPGILHGVEFIELKQNDILLLHSLAYQKLIERADMG